MPLPLYLDEHVQFELAARLRARGFDVLTTQEAGMIGAEDEAQLEFAAQSGRVMYSQNIRDFKALAVDWVNSGKRHAGIMYSSAADAAELCVWICAAFDLYDEMRDLTIGLPLAD